jgi:hypothetical protein
VSLQHRTLRPLIDPKNSDSFIFDSELYHPLPSTQLRHNILHGSAPRKVDF